MKYFIQPIRITAIFILFYLAFIHEVYGYIDPGSGSYIFQILIGFLLGGLFAIKLFWNKIKVFFKKLFFSRAQKHERT